MKSAITTRSVSIAMTEYLYEHGITVYEISQRTGMPTASLYNLLSGSRKAGGYLSTWLMICHALDIPFEDILRRANKYV